MTVVIRPWQSPNGSWSRTRLIVAFIACLAIVVTAVGAIFPTDFWRVELSGARLTYTFNQPVESGADAAVVLKDDFSDSGGEWDLRDTDAALVELSGGGLRIVVRDKQSVDFEVRPLPGDRDAIRVEVEATLLAGGEDAVLGLFCAVSAGADAPHAGGGGAYVMMIEPATRRTGIGRGATPLGAEFEVSDGLHQGTLPGNRKLSRTIHLGADCVGGARGSRRVSFRVDGRSAGSGTHAASPARFDGVGIAVYRVSGGAAPDIRFDNLVVTALDP